MSDQPKKLLRRCIVIPASRSPNVRLALAEIAAGREPSGKNVFPGVLTWKEYQRRRQTWDKIRQCIGLDAQFYEGSDVLLFPAMWLDHSHRLNVAMWRAKEKRRPVAMGVDPAEGGDKSSWALVDEKGVVMIHSALTPNTNAVRRKTIELMRQYRVPPENVLFDAGGGGKQHADMLTEMGFPVRCVGFGDAPEEPLKYRGKTVREREDEKGERSAYRNRRAQMYWELAALIDPDGDRGGFAIPPNPGNNDVYHELRKQLAPIPKRYDGEGKIYLPPKRNKPNAKNAEPSLEQIIGHSPDEADALVLAVHAMLHPAYKPVVEMML